MATLTTLSIANPTAITQTTLIHIVVTGDTSQGNPDGSSYKAELQQLSSLFAGGSDTYLTGGTYSNGTATFTNNTGGTFNVTGFITGDTYTTGYTYSNNTFTIKQNNEQSDLTATIDTMTGLTVNGTLSATTISATTINLNGQTPQTQMTWVTRTNASTSTYSIPSGNYGIINRYTLTSRSEYILPATCAIGDMIEIIEDKSSSSSSRIRANSGQTIRVSNYGTTTTAGYFDTVNTDNVAIRLVCITANSKWAVTSYFSDYSNGSGSIPTIN